MPIRLPRPAGGPWAEYGSGPTAMGTGDMLTGEFGIAAAGIPM